MKYRLISVTAVLLILGIAVGIQGFEPAGNRYHQHAEAANYTPCEDHGDEQFCTHLPLFNIVTDEPMPEPYVLDENGEPLMDELGSHITNDEMVAASVEFFTNSDGNNHLTDEPDVCEKGLIRIRGKSSRGFDKKGYLLKFVKENGVNGLNVSLDGMVRDNTWVLHGPILDKTLLRNYLCYNLTAEVMDYVPEVRFCELFLNGEYEGVYLLTEKIDYNKSGRCNITKTDPKLATTAYILRLDTGNTDEAHLLTTFFDYTGRRGMDLRLNEIFEIIYPSTTLTQEQKETIAGEISQMEKSLVSFDSADRKRGYPAYLDVESFADFFVLNEFLMNADAGKLSTYFCKDIGGKITIVGWDYNNTFNNYMTDLSDHEDFFITNQWYSYLLKDQDFVDRVVRTYWNLRKTILSDDYLCDYIDDVIAYLGPAVERNNERWGYTFTEEYARQNRTIVLQPLERNPKDYDEAVTQLKETICARGAFMDAHIESLYARCHASTNKQFTLQDGE